MFYCINVLFTALLCCSLYCCCLQHCFVFYCIVAVYYIAVFVVPQAINAQGVDRHLLGMKILASQAGMETPSIYTDVAYSRSLTHGLSTSQVSHIRWFNTDNVQINGGCIIILLLMCITHRFQLIWMFLCALDQLLKVAMESVTIPGRTRSS